VRSVGAEGGGFKATQVRYAGNASIVDFVPVCRKLAAILAEVDLSLGVWGAVRAAKSSDGYYSLT
jgi:hypothetical protein